MPVFLSASVPDPKRNPQYFKSGHAMRIREAVTQLTRVLVARDELVFGGHPAISPLVLTVANQLNAASNVVIYQSEFFKASIPTESMAFPHLKWTPEVQGQREPSLLGMRETMIGCRAFDAGFFLGGMEGVEEELEIFKRLNPTASVYPIASTGAAARLLFDRGEGPQDRQLRRDLDRELVYGYLFKKLLALVP
tara:strand:+ start:9770 stop:10351 length:582 start_codon:yes stop_codon:yes gene_type:complete